MSATEMEIMQARHAVRSYQDKPIPADVRERLEKAVEGANGEGHLHMQLLFDEADAFTGVMAHYGKFEGVRNYLAIVGENTPDLDERAGYYGERIVLLAQELGLNSCWVGMTFSKRRCKAQVGRGERLAIVVALGYGVTQGVPHKSKPAEELCSCEGERPDWLEKGMEAAMLAPTAVNQQKFRITCTGPESARIENLGGMYSKVDLGIVRHDFEVGAGRSSFSWA